jgi:hypothetical protein
MPPAPERRTRARLPKAGTPRVTVVDAEIIDEDEKK